MAMPYKLIYNAGNENIGSAASITAQEDPRVCSSDLLAQEIVHICPLAMDKKVVNLVLAYFGQAVLNLMAQGWKVPVYADDKELFSCYADVFMKETFNLAKAQQRDSSVTTLTQDQMSLVLASDIDFRAYVQQTAGFTTLLKALGEGLERTGTESKAKVSKSTSDTTSGSSDTGSGTQLPDLETE